MSAFPSQTTIFTSPNTFSIDESKLCFNKTHFNRDDFNVERFMNLARQKASLKTIQQDLRLYLKSVQNSMIELINDDYADFVHLSSHLVSLQELLAKIEHDVNKNWRDFEDSTWDSIKMSQKIEEKCNELCSNREKQSELRDRISYLCAIDKLSGMIRQRPISCSILWLQKAATFVMEIKSSTGSYQLTEEERNAETLILSQLEAILCSEGVASASTNCRSLPVVLSILSLTDSVHSLTAQLVSELLYSKFVDEYDVNEAEKWHQLRRLENVFENTKKMRQTWADMIGVNNFTTDVSNFLDETLLTFVLTFIDKCMGAVAVPSDTRLFHKCLMATQNFIDTWPSAPTCRTMLKAIRDKFNLLVYFKLETNRYGKTIDQLLIPDEYENSSKTGSGEEVFYFQASETIFGAIEHVWSDDVYVPHIIDKLWDFTLRMLMKHFGWSKAMKSYFNEEKQDWVSSLYLRAETEKFHQEVFNFALETIWGKFNDVSIDTAPFGQCLSKHGRSIDQLCCEIDADIINLFSNVACRELAQVSDVPKHYRWTKKVPPTSCSKYVKNFVGMIKSFQEKIEKEQHPDAGEMMRKISHVSFNYFVEKAKEVQDGVEATGSSLSRFKRKATPDHGVSDDEKIKLQIYHDGLFLLENSISYESSEEDLIGLRSIVNRFDFPKENERSISRKQENGNDEREESVQMEKHQEEL
uniref:Conserved oligomeric Golgi complex subunit 2 n=1 Tax=Caenorhabditis tropicalis TaxID=1561998 RepID=A0A1I7V4P0_9PELO